MFFSHENSLGSSPLFLRRRNWRIQNNGHENGGMPNRSSQPRKFIFWRSWMLGKNSSHSDDSKFLFGSNSTYLLRPRIWMLVKYTYHPHMTEPTVKTKLWCGCVEISENKGWRIVYSFYCILTKMTPKHDKVHFCIILSNFILNLKASLITQIWRNAE